MTLKQVLRIGTITLFFLFLLFFSPAKFSQGGDPPTLTIEKADYAAGELIQVLVDQPPPDSALVVYAEETETGTIPLRPENYLLLEGTGTRKLAIVDSEGTVLTTESINLEDPYLLDTRLQPDEAQYAIGDIMRVDVLYPEAYAGRIILKDPSTTYSYEGTETPISFFAQEEGVHEIIMEDEDGTVLRKAEVLVLGSDATAGNTPHLSFERELPTSVGYGQAFNISLVLATTEDITNLTITEHIPEGWQVLNYPPEATLENHTLHMGIPPGNSTSHILTYTMKSPQEEGIHTFDAELHYVRGMQPLGAFHSSDIRVTDSFQSLHAAYAISYRGYDVGRMVYPGVPYDVDVWVTNVGDNTTDYPVYLRIPLKGSKYALEPQDDRCYPETLHGAKRFVCSWGAIAADETRNARFTLQTTAAAPLHLPYEVTYDPPEDIGFWKRFWDLATAFFADLFSQQESPTGNVVAAPLPPEPQEEPETFQLFEEDATMKASLENIPAVVDGKTVLDAGESVYPEDDDVLFSFVLSDDVLFTNPITLCSGTEYTCLWDPGTTEGYCTTCYLRVELDRGLETVTSPFQYVTVDTVAPRITSLEPVAGSILQEDFTVSCTAEDDQDIDYVLYFRDASLWQRLCAASSCPFSWTQAEGIEVDIRCVAKDDLHVTEEINQGIRRAVPSRDGSGSGSSREAVPPPETIKRWYSTNNTLLFDVQLPLPAELHAQGREGRTIEAETLLIRTSEGKQHVETRFPDLQASIGLDSVVLHDVQDGPVDLRIDALQPVDLPKMKQFRKGFSIDPSSIAFAEGQVTLTAEGTELWKCASWDFASQTCPGEWVFVQKLIPGETYEITFTADDPAFAEAGVATINTDKPIYLPGETATITMAVLNNRGALVKGARVWLDITRPDNTTAVYSTDTLTLAEIKPGIYQAQHLSSVAGTYVLDVRAEAELTNQTMSSHYEVMDDYAFDILREAPFVIDPWKGPFMSNITVFQRNGTTPFNLTEQVPLDAAILDAGGAVVSSDNVSTYLTWTGLSNATTVRYELQAPLVSPSLLVLGSAIIDHTTRFLEARPWYIAVDPDFVELLPETIETCVETGSDSTCLVSEVNESDDVYASDPQIRARKNGADAILGTRHYDSTAVPAGATINNVTLVVEWYVSSTSGLSCEVGVWDNTTAAYSRVTQTCPPTSEGFTVFDLYEKGIDNEQDAENAKINMTFSKSGNGVPNIYIDWVVVNVTYTADPAPYGENATRNETTIYQDMLVYFETNWSDNIALSGYVFSNNQSGSWVNDTFVAFSGTANTSSNVTNITAAAGTVVGWRFFANDSYDGWNATDIQTFAVASSSDATEPTISGETVTPAENVSGYVFNITATITDDVGVASADVEMLFPNGSRTNISMTPSGSTYYLEYVGRAGGEHFFTIFAEDGSANINRSFTGPSFNVTSNATIDRYYYDRPDTILLNLSGFSADTDVAIDIFNESGVSIGFGFPVYRRVNVSGANATSVAIPSDLTLNTGNHTLVIVDNTSTYLDINLSFRIIHKANAATKTDTNGSGVDQLYEVNYTDGIVSLIDASNAEDYVDLTFADNVPTVGYSLGSTILSIEHFQEQSNNLIIQWYNETSLSYVTACTITQSATERFDSCNLTPFVDSLDKANDLKIRLTDNDNVNNNEWQNTDFVFLDIDVYAGAAISVQINDPSLVRGVYNFENDTTNNRAYDGGTTATSPPPTGAPSEGTEATAAEYVNASESDDLRYYTLVTGTGGERAYQSFKFTTTEAVNDMTEFRILHEGNATQGTAPSADDFEIHIYNFTLGGYQQIQTITGSGSEVNTVITLTQGLADFVNTSGEVWILVQGDHTVSGGPNAQAQLFTDYVEFRVSTLPILSGPQLINATAVDYTDGVAACNYSYVNASGIQLGPYGLLNSTDQDYWTNSSDTGLIGDGVYTVWVNCTDTGGELAYDSVDVRVSNAEPTVSLLHPLHLTNYTVDILNFSWNASSTSPGNLICDLFLDGVENISNVIAVNGANTSREIGGLAEGAHSWYVNCTKGSQSNVSTTAYFDIDTKAPLITLDYPLPGSYHNNQSQWFNYTPDDSHNLTNCSLLFDGLINQTNTSIARNQTNNFTLAGVSEGFHTWGVNCTDVFGFTGNSTVWNFTVDLTDPIIYLNTSNDTVFSDGEAILNFTVYDNLDANLTCNVTINGSIDDTNVSALNGTTISRTILKPDGNYIWNVTCWDDANNTNYSATNNFSLSGPPVVVLWTPLNNTWDKGGDVNFTFYAEDGNGLKNCTLLFDGNENQSLNSSQLDNGGNNTFNLSDIDEGYHLWNVNCTDTGDYSRTNIGDFNLTIDRTDPHVTITGPDDGSNYTDGDLSFNFTVTDNLDDTLVCNLSISGHTVSAENTDLQVLNGSAIITLNETNIADGVHHWNVTCIDNATNWNTSETWNFTVNGAPVVTLLAPENGNISNGSVVNLTYNVTDINGVVNCSLLWDGQYNSTVYAADIDEGGANNFTLFDVPGTNHTWQVACFDSSDQEGFSETGNITIDTVLPTVYAYDPNGTTIDTNDLSINFSVIDDIAESLYCNVTISGGYSNVSYVPNATNYTMNFTDIPDGFHTWNATCYDNASNADTGETLNFTIDAAPQVIMDDPLNDTVDTDGDLSFQYRVYEGSLANCSLYFNNTRNRTEGAANITEGGATNTFNLTGVPEGLYPWLVVCEDTNGFNGTDADAPFYVHVDFTPPNVSLRYPNDTQMVYASWIEFNFTVNDTVDNVLLCNLSINGTVNKTVNATDGEDTLVNVTGFEQGNHTWNVTCTDGGFAGYSETWSFYINNTPQVALQSPYNTSQQGSENVTMYYTPQSAIGFNLGFCEFFFDGQSNQTEAGLNVVNNGLNNFSVEYLPEGEHNWSVTCQDNNGEQASDGPWYFTVDLQGPDVTANAPNGTLYTSYPVTFNFTAADIYDDILLCNITANGTLAAFDIEAASGNDTLEDVSGFLDGLFFWNVTCIDNATNLNTSLTYNFTVQIPPTVTLDYPPNGSRTNIVNQTLNYTPDDNSNSLENCSLFVNGAYNQSNQTSITAGEEKGFNLTNLTDGTYVWNVTCTDPSGNVGANDSALTFYIDLTGPTINLTYPNESQTFNGNDITFNWTAEDFAGTTITCNISIDGLTNFSNLDGISPASFNYTELNMTEGDHNWSVLCWDDLNNTAQSEVRNFTINQPDLYLHAANVTFNDANPDENQTIIINATIENKGGNDANDVIVAFWDGDPEAGGIPLGNDSVTVEAGDVSYANISWNITIGLHTIHIRVDPDDVIGELDETNNNASLNFSLLRTRVYWPLVPILTNASVTELNFTVQNFTGGQLNYTVYVDDTPNGQTGNLTDNTSTLLNITLAEGIHTVIIGGWDGLERAKNSTGINITVDLTPPNVTYHTANETWFNTPNPSINFSIFDAIDQQINYTLFFNDSVEDTGLADNSSYIIQNFTNLENGTWLVIADTLDDANNSANSSVFTFYVDTLEPDINLTQPPNTSSLDTNDIELNFTTSDNMADYLVCNLTMDGSNIREDFQVTPGIEVNTTTMVSEGTHYWNVTCIDRAGNYNHSRTFEFSTNVVPNITLFTPENETWTSQATQLFTYNVSDGTGIENCSILINGVVNQTNDTIVNNATNNFTVSGLGDVVIWAIQCYDNTTNYNYDISENRTLYVDQVNPFVNITTPNLTYFQDTTPPIDFNSSDNLDTILNITAYVDDLENLNTSAANGSASLDLATISEGEHAVILEARDEANNTYNSTPITIYVDVTDPNITLYNPLSGESLDIINVTFNFTVIDNFDLVLACNLSVTGEGVTELNVTNGSIVLHNLTNLAYGIHHWNVTCIDNATNWNTSETRNFTIPSPDLTVHAENITFNVSSPVEGQNVTVSAEVFNVGASDADDVLIQFWLGDPDVNGTQINGNFTVNLTSGQNATLSVNHTTIIGSNFIYVVVDPPTGTNGSIPEENENNNKAYRDLYVGEYHTFAGNTTDVLRLDDSTDLSLFQWDLDNATGGHILVTDTDSDIQFTSLRALSRNISDFYQPNDFTDLDGLLNITNSSNESINNTWTENGLPVALKNITLYNRNVLEVPIVNSTNNSNFFTGILWDESDGTPAYDGTQDVIFVAEINENTQGYAGISDFEIRIPARLRSYISGTETVTFYTELP